MTNMRIEGGTWSDSNIVVPIGEKEDIGKSLPPMLLRWQKVSSKVIEGGEHNEKLWRDEFKDAIRWLYGKNNNR